MYMDNLEEPPFCNYMPSGNFLVGFEQSVVDSIRESICVTSSF